MCEAVKHPLLLATPYEKTGLSVGNAMGELLF